MFGTEQPKTGIAANLRFMLHEFLMANRNQLIQRCIDKVAKRIAPAERLAGVNHGVPLFLQQVIDTLRTEHDAVDATLENPEPTPTVSDIGRGAAVHGAELLNLGYTVDQVVHEYGDLCQSATELAVERSEPISANEFRVLNRCLDNAIADAVTAYGSQHRIALNAGAESLYERLASFSTEQRALLEAAIEGFSAIQTGKIGLTGSTGTVVMQSLLELRAHSNWAMSQIRLALATTTLGRS